MTVRVARRTGVQAFRQGAPILDLDFAGGSGLPPGSFVRAGAGYAPTSGGVLVPFASGVPRNTDRGFLIEESRRNKLTIYNANPTSTTGMVVGIGTASLAIVDDAAALAARGLSLVATSGAVFRLDNSAGATPAYVNLPQAVGNLNVHTMSVYARGGTGAVGLSNPADPFTTWAASSDYSRPFITLTPTTTGRSFTVRADAGQVIYFILPQLEEGASLTSPIVTEGSAVTRGAEAATITGLPLTAPYTVLIRARSPATSQSFPTLLQLSDGTNNNIISVQQNAGRARVFVGVAGVQTGSLDVGAWPNDTIGTFAIRVRAGSVAASFNQGAVVSGVMATPVVDRATLGSRVVGNQHWNSVMERPRITAGDLSDAQLQGLVL